VIDVLRLAQDSDLLTAEVFEELFTREIGRVATLRRVGVAPWCRAILGPPSAPWAPDRAARRFAAATRRSDVLCPNWQAIVLAPLLVWLRNRSRARVRLLLIAHAPGCYALEWALLTPLLRPGDRIVAASHNAKAAIEFLSPTLAPWIRVVPHPMAPLPRSPRSRSGDRLVSLGRIVPGKLLHRQIEAMDVLRTRGRRLPVMEIAGALEDGGRPGPGPYARTLIEKIRRLDLTDHVRLVGPIKGADAKAEFLSNARALVNLSVTVEESFGKAPVEALGLGVPVLGTRWNGLPETIGDCGALVPVVATAGGSVDVSPHAIADAIAHLIDRPPDRDACVKQAEQFAPAAILPRYAALLEETVDARAGDSDGRAEQEPAVAPAAPATGLLSVLPPLTRMSWRELFDRYLETCRTVRCSWDGGAPGAPSTGDRLRALMLASTRGPLERFSAGLPPASDPPAAVPRIESAALETDFVERIAASVMRPGLLSGRLACLVEVRDGGRADLLAHGVALLEREGIGCAGVGFLRAEERCLAGDYEAAVRQCLAIVDATVDTETAVAALRQLARLARKWQRPELALPLLTEWLDRFPDSPDAGPVWLDRAVNILQSAHADLDVGRFAIERARALLGDHPVVAKAASLFALRAISAA
jgi:glycosyltransferase involved in cell wall biosynthesis